MDIERITKLEREQRRALEAALNSAFPSFDELKRMYKYTFDKNLDLPDSGTLVFNLIESAEATGKINQLILGAFKENPDNPELKAFVESIKRQKSPAELKNVPPASSDTGSFKYFKTSVLIQDITHDHIMDLRADKHKEFYYERDFDTELFEWSLAGNNILLLGNSLAGKTRAIYELIRKLALQFPDTYIIFPKNIPIGNKPIKLPLKEGYRHIAFIEDIDDYYKNENNTKKRYDKMIKELVRGKVQIFATCRTGPEYKEYKRLSKSKVREIFRKIMVGKIKREVVQGFDESIIGDIEQREFDGNIGSIFMDIEKMRDRYRDLLNAKTAEADIAIKIMRSLKTFYFASNFTGKSAYNAEAVKDFCLRLSVSKNASPKKAFNNSIGEEIAKQERVKLAEEIEAFNKKLSAALMLLESDEDNLNFIRQNSSRLEVEEVYLEKIVRYSPFKLLKDLDRLYDAKGEKRTNGFYVKTNNYNNLLKNLPFPAAESLFYEMRSKSIMPNADSFSLLIEKADTYELALKWFDKLKRFRIPPNESVLMAIIYKANIFEEAVKYLGPILDLLMEDGKKESDVDFQYQVLTMNFLNLEEELSAEQVSQYLDTFQERLIPISSIVFNRMINRPVKNIKDANTYLKWITIYQIEPDPLTLNLVIEKSSSLEQGLEFLDLEVFNSIELSETVLDRLIAKSTTLREGITLLEKEPFNSITVTESILDRLIRKCTSLEEGLDLLQKDRFSEVTLSESILVSLLGKSSSLEKGLDLLVKKPFNEIPVSESILNRLLNKSTSLSEGLSLLGKEPFNTVAISESILNSLIVKSTSLEEGLDLLTKEPYNTVAISESILNSLLQKSTSLAEGIALIEKDGFVNVSVSESILITLLGKSTTLKEGTELLEEDRFIEIPLSEGTLNFFIGKSASLAEGLGFLEKERFNKIPISRSILNWLLGKTISLEEALALMKKEMFEGISIGESTLNILLGKSNSLTEGLGLLEKEPFNSIPIGESTLNIFLAKSSSLREGLDLLQEKQFKTIPVSEIILNLLVGKASSLTEGLKLLEQEGFNKIPLGEGILNTLLEKSRSTEDITKAIHLIESSKAELMSYYFLRTISNRVSFYKDLLNIPFFSDHYKLYSEFSYIDYAVQNYAETIHYFKNFEFSMTRFAWNHMTFLLLDKHLIKEESQKAEIFEWFNFQQKELSELSEQSELRKMYFLEIDWETNLFPDIKEMWDNYKFPSD